MLIYTLACMDLLVLVIIISLFWSCDYVQCTICDYALVYRFLFSALFLSSFQ